MIASQIRRTKGLSAVACAAALLGAVASAGAQEMEPKAYSASPVGARFLVLALGRSAGGIVFDPAVPITDADAKIGSAAAGVGLSFGLGGKLALFSVVVPYAWGDVTGNVGGTASATSRSGMADIRTRFSVNLLGNPAMSPAQFAKAPRRTIVGASLAVTIPTGQYYDTKLINVGTNRWAFKPEIGVSIPWRRLDLDAYVGAWFLGTNGDFYPGGHVKTQDPVYGIQFHAAYTIRPRWWVSVDSTWYTGGGASVDGAPPSQPMSNSRLGATLSMPVGKGQSVKIGWSSGVAVRTGTNFNTVAVGWQKLWLARPKPAAK